MQTRWKDTSALDAGLDRLRSQREAAIERGDSEWLSAIDQAIHQGEEMRRRIELREQYGEDEDYYEYA